jgi:putative integral membrane protein (TIGR02587 family)
MPRKPTKRHPVSVSVREYARGATGGLLFSLPLFYTMETWETGSLASPIRVLAGLAGTFVLLLGYNRYAGLRQDASATEIVIDSIEELGLGLTAGACILWLLGRLTSDMSAVEIVNRVVVQTMTAAIGVSIGTAQLGGEPRDQGSGGAERERGLRSHVALGACGAVVLAANVAPTEEVLLLGLELNVWQLSGLAALSFGIGSVVLHYSDFAGTKRATRPGVLEATRHGAIVYAVALAASGMLLWFFGRFDDMPAGIIAAQIVVLGFPAALGASAGRLLLQT